MKHLQQIFSVILYCLLLNSVAFAFPPAAPQPPTVESDPVTGAITGLVKADGGGNISAAVADTDYAPSSSPTLVTPELGAATGTSVDLGGTTLLGSRLITVDTGGVLDINMGTASGDDFTIDTSAFVVEGDTGDVGVGTATPLADFHVLSPQVLIGASTASQEVVSIDFNQNEDTETEIVNLNSGTDSVSSVSAKSDVGQIKMRCYSSGYTAASQAYMAGKCGLQARVSQDVDLVFQAPHASSDIYFMPEGYGTDGAADVFMTIESDGDIGIGSGVVSPDTLIHADKGTGYGGVKLDGSTGACLMMRDTDDSGWTECVFLNGAIDCGIDADGACDGAGS